MFFLIRIAIVDDSLSDMKDFEGILNSEIRKLGIQDYAVFPFSSGDAFWESYNSGSYTLIFLDIFLGKETGVQIARRIRETDAQAIIVFITTSNEFASESYAVGASYYLQKPLKRESVRDMLMRINLTGIAKNRIIKLPGDRRVLIRDITYTEVHDHTLTIYLSNGGKVSAVVTHAEIERLLKPNKEFCTVGQANIINFNYVENLDKLGFTMQDGRLIQVPRRRYKEVKDRFYNFLFEQREGSL